MSAQPFVMFLNVLYLVLMGLISLAGTSALVELTFVLLRCEPRQTFRSTLEAEDA